MMMILFLIAALCATASGEIVEEPSDKQACFSKCDEVHVECTPKSENWTAEENLAEEKCTYDSYACSRKCEGLEPPRITLEQYVCQSNDCMGEQCWTEVDGKEVEDKECVIKQYNCFRSCAGREEMTMEQYESATAVCDPKREECLSSGKSGYFCEYEDGNCMEDFI